MDIINKKQKLLLEYLFSNKDLFVTCARILQPQYFERPLDRVVEFSKEFFMEYSDLPDFDIIEAETEVHLIEREVDRSEHDYVRDELEEHCRDEAMKLAILESVELLENNSMGAIQECVRKAMLVKLDNSIGTDFFENPMMRIANMSTTVDERSIGLPNFDGLIGNIRRGEMGIIYGTTGGGKSVTMANIAYYLAKQGLDGVIISLELNEALYSKRLDTIFTGTDIKHHADNAVEISESLEGMHDQFGSILVKHIVGATLSDIRTYLLEYHLANGKYPDFMMVDYLGIMKLDIGSYAARGGKFEIDEEKAQGLREIIDEYHMYGFTAGQINRDGYGIVEITAAHVAGGKSVVDTSDWSVALVATEEDIDNNQIQVKQLKVRNNGKSSKPINLYMNPHSLKITENPSVAKPSGSVKLGKSKQTPATQSQAKSKIQDAINRTKKR